MTATPTLSLAALNDTTTPQVVTGSAETCHVTVNVGTWGDAVVAVEYSIAPINEARWFAFDPAINLSTSRTVASFGCAGLRLIRLRVTTHDGTADTAAEWDVIFD